MKFEPAFFGRGHVGSDEIFLFPQTNHGRWSIARCHDLIRLVHRNDRQRKHTGYVPHRLAHRFLQRWPVTIAWVEEIFFDQMGDDLSIRFGGELVAFLDQPEVLPKWCSSGFRKYCLDE